MSNSAYDAIIIGAGIGGLVCGCYLAKAGMKVLICEQHNKPGGYCTSFKRQGFTFDAAAHAIGGYCKGYIKKIFQDLDLDIKLQKIDPSDIIILPDKRQVAFWSSLERTIIEFQSLFSDEVENIKKFFDFLASSNTNTLISLRNKTFLTLLNSYFKNDDLKNVISFPLLGNSSLPPSQLSAFMGVKIFQEFLLDGGYYTQAGFIQNFTDHLVKKFHHFKGELRLSTKVKQIKIIKGVAAGVILENGEYLIAKHIISNCDATQTFLKLISSKNLPETFFYKLKKMVPSSSGFMAYVGLKEDFFTSYNSKFLQGSNIWVMRQKNIEEAYKNFKNQLINPCGYVVHISKKNKTLFAFMNYPYRKKIYWKKNKYNILSVFLKEIEQDLFPNFADYIVYKDAATPHTLKRFTSNYKGATFGWASSPSQLIDPDFHRPNFIQNFYLVGHWSTYGIGIPGVAYVAYATAHLILRRRVNDR